MSKWAAVIGTPIDHSLSPVLHERAYKEIGIEAKYYSFDIGENDLGHFMQDLGSSALGTCMGLSVTMPCKRRVMDYVDVCDSLTKAVGAANTVVTSPALNAGFNTDVHGIVEAVRDSFDGEPLTQLRRQNQKHSALILGTGATASSVLAAAVSLGYGNISVVGRSFAGPDTVLRAANRLHVQFDPILWKNMAAVESASKGADLLISTVPGAISAPLANMIRPGETTRVLDVVYGHGPSLLTEACRPTSIVSPLRMLVYQGLAQVKLMTGREAPFAPVFHAVSSAFGG